MSLKTLLVSFWFWFRFGSAVVHETETKPKRNFSKINVRITRKMVFSLKGVILSENGVKRAE